MSKGLLSPDDPRARQFLRLQEALLVLDTWLRKARDHSLTSSERADILRQVDVAVDEARHRFLQTAADRDVLQRIPRWLLPRSLRTGPESAEVVGFGGLGLLSHILAAADGDDRRLAEDLANQPTAWTALALLDDWEQALTATGPTPQIPRHNSAQQSAAWLPLVHQANGGAYLTVVHIGSRPEWANPVQADFASALRTGRALALEWGARIGVDDDTLREIAAGQLWVEGVPGALMLADGSGQAAATVAALQQMLRPDRAEAVLTSQAEPTPDTDAKASAAAEHRARLVRVPPDAPAERIAEAAWPTSWREAVRRTATAALDSAGHAARILTDLPGDIDPPVVDNVAVLVDMEQAARLSAALEHGHRSLVVGGPAASGRTTCARLGAAQWQDRTLGRVVELRLAEGRLPALDELQITIHRAQQSLRLTENEPILWILDDLTPHEDACDLDAVLAPASSEATGSIVAVCLYAGGQHWSADLLVTIPSLAGPDSTGRFLEKLNGARIGRPLEDWELSKVRRAAGADLWMAGRLFSRFASAPDGRDSDAELLEAAKRRALVGVPTEQVPVLKVIAACSLLSVGFPAALLDGLAPSVLRGMGGRKDYFGRWRLRSPSLCAALVSSGGIPENHTRYHQYPVEALIGELLPYFSDRLADETALRLLLALLDRARVLAPAVHRRLLRALGGRIIAAVDAAKALPLLARVLLVLDAGAESQDRTELLGHLLDGLVARGWTRLRAVEAYACVRALRAYRDDAYGRRAGDLRSVLRTASTELDVVVMRAGPTQSLPVIRELHAFHEEVTARSIPALVHAALSSADPLAWRDYQSASDLLLLAVRTTPGQQLATLSEFADAAGLRALLRSPGANVDPATTLGRLALQRLLTGTSALNESPAPRLGEAALVFGSVSSRSSVTRTRMGLTLLERVDRAYAHQLAQRANLGLALVQPLTVASGGEAAGMLQILSRLHLPAAAQLLYDHDGHVRTDIVIQLASACSSTMDLKGAGHLLNTVGLLDLSLAVPLDSAGTALARQLRPFLEQAIGDDVRASVVKHAVRGLITARCDSAQLDALRETCLSVIEREIRDNDKEHGPQLALLLAGSDALGPSFLSALAGRVDEDVVVERMHGAQTPQALAAFHDLGRTLTLAASRDLVHTFTTQWLEPTLDRISNYPPLSQLEAAAAIAKTLAAAGVADSGRLVLQHGGSAAWGQRLSRVSNPGVLASCLENLHNISPLIARQVVAELAQVLAGPARGGGHVELRVAPRAGAPSPLWLVPAHQGTAKPAPQVPIEGFVRMLGRAFLEPEPVLNVLGALEKIETDVGNAVGEALTELPSWPSRRRALMDEIDNPVQLGHTVRRMRALSLEVSPEAVSTMAATWVAQASSLRSPLAAESLLRGFAAIGGDDVAMDFADRLVPQRLGERLSRCLSDDLHVLPSLLDSLRVWAPTGRAEEVAAYVPLQALSALDASAAARLLAALIRCSPALARGHLPAALEVLHRAIGQRYAVDHAGEWVGIGWLARNVAACGATVTVSDAALADVAALQVQPAVRLWALAHLGGDCAAAVHEAVEVVRIAEPRKWVYAATLLGSLQAGVPAAELELELFPEALEAEPEWVLALLGAAATDPTLTAWLAPDGRWLVDTAEWAAENGQPRGRDVARLAVALFGDVTLTGA